MKTTRIKLEAQLLSGRMLDSGLRGRRFEPHLWHCVVFLSKTLIIFLVLKLITCGLYLNVLSMLVPHGNLSPYRTHIGHI